MNKYKVWINNQELDVTLVSRTDNQVTFEINGATYNTTVEPVLKPIFATATAESAHIAPRTTPQPPAGSSDCVAPLPGIVIDIKVKVGDDVKTGDRLLVLEAMKMENPITAKRPGRVSEICVTKSSQVKTGDLLIKFA